MLGLPRQKRRHRRHRRRAGSCGGPPTGKGTGPHEGAPWPEVAGDGPGPSYSIDKHRAVIETPGYRPELDLVAAGPDGALAAYALGWLDERTHALLFEPVGTDPAHSGRGLARALCAQMLRIAAQLGAKEAIVGPRGDPGYPLPRRVYEGLGMREVAQFVSMTNAQN